jgi:hypothetical protein
MTHTKIIAQIYGGLGNQMFQYACGRALAIRSGGELMLDWRDFRSGPGQAPGLEHLSIVTRPAMPSELPPDKSRPIRHGLWRMLKRSPRFVRQRGLGFNPEVLTLSGRICLRGYWQSEHYFADAADQVRRELQVRTEPDGQNADLLREIAERPAVSLHLRRGDYVSNPKTRAVHNVCTLDYYRRAADLMALHMREDPVFYVFSDEPGWARDNLQLPFEIRVVDHNDSRRSYEDLRLMAACIHHIIANSSFSWWGAWLNPSADKIVVAPSRWFADPGTCNPDILPADWIALEP